MKRSSAFTLLEVVLAITILAGLTATVFRIVDASVQGAASLAESQKQNDRIQTVFQTFRTTFQNFPGAGTISLEVIEDDDPVIQELSFSAAPSAFPIGAFPANSGDSVISLREQPLDRDNPERGVLYTLAISRQEFAPPEDGEVGFGLRVESDRIRSAVDDQVYQDGIPQDDYTADEDGRYWFPLLYNVRALEWGVYDPDEEEFLPEWTSEDDRPKVIELNLLLEGWDMPVRAVFSVSDIPPPKEQPAQTNTNNNTGSQGTSPEEDRPVTPGGGGNNNNGNVRPGGGDARPGDGGGRPTGGGGPPSSQSGGGGR